MKKIIKKKDFDKKKIFKNFQKNIEKIKFWDRKFWNSNSDPVSESKNVIFVWFYCQNQKFSNEFNSERDTRNQYMNLM